MTCWVAERQAIKLRDGWTVAAEQYPQACGAVPWDVRLEHTDGSRIPAGTNLHPDPVREMQRLSKVLDY